MFAVRDIVTYAVLAGIAAAAALATLPVTRQWCWSQPYWIAYSTCRG